MTTAASAVHVANVDLRKALAHVKDVCSGRPRVPCQRKDRNVYVTVQDEPGGPWWIERRVEVPDRRWHDQEGWTHSVERRWGLRDRRMQVRARELAVC
jgi:hypothetical protein